MSGVIVVSSRGFIGISVVTVANCKTNILGNSTHNGGTYAVLLGAAAVRHASDRIVRVIVSSIIGVAEIQISLVIEYKTRVEVDRPVVVLRLEHGSSEVRSRCIQLADDVIKTGLYV